MRTALFDRHCALGAKIVDFCGWQMPLHYSGIISEHHNVREKVGIFDVSHMGRILITGPDAGQFLEYISTNHILDRLAGTATYTVWCNSEGASVDDVIVYKIDEENFFVIVNACNKEKDFQHLLEQGKNFNVKISHRFEEEGILAVQGPTSAALVQELFGRKIDLTHMHFTIVDDLILSRTGYTGEDGFEIYVSNATIILLWDRFLKIGNKYGILPIGLGARDTLRLEMGYALYGHELSEEIAPNESVSAWTIKGEKAFLGKEAMEKRGKRRAYGVILHDPGVARAEYLVYKNDREIGKVTSGTFSPSLNKAIALILSTEELNEGDNVDIDIRNKRCRAEIVKIPFIKERK